MKINLSSVRSHQLGFLLSLFLVLFYGNLSGQITEGFETGQSTSGYTTTATLGSGTWTGTDCLLRSNMSVHGGSYSSQLKASTGILKTPSLNTVGTVTFWCNKNTGITVSKTVGGNTSSITPTIGIAVSSLYPYTITVNDASTAVVISINNTTTGTGYIDDFSSTAYSLGFSVSYNGNSSTSGIVPTDSNSYSSGANVTVKSNSGNLIKTGYSFANWNTKADGTGTDYAASGSDSFSITTNTTLYAKWNINQYTVTYDGNGNNGGSVPSSQTVNYNSTIVLNSNSLTKTGYTFNG